jgi:signal transduction histidine kinase
LNRSISLRRPAQRPARQVGGAVVVLVAAIVAGVALAELLMSPPAADLRDLAIFLAFSGAVTIGAGWLAFRSADRAIGLSITSKAFLGAAIGSAVSLLNVFIVSGLMFLSTSHDLPLLITLLLFSAIVSVYFSLRVASALTRGIETIAHGIIALAEGRYATRVEVDGGDEVARLGDRLNELARRLAESEERRTAMDRERRELTAAISHDLRTPLASVRAMVEALDDEVVQEPEEISRYYAAIRREIERLSRMIDDLFELAQIDAGALKLNRQPIALQEVAAEVVDAMRAQARRDGVALTLRLEGSPPDLSLDGTRIERAVANLIRNALEHTPAGGRVEVTVAVQEGCAALRVSDTGEGIDPRDLPHIWDRFYRAERSRQRGPRADQGAGLGLAIVRGIVEAHGGEVTAASLPGQGAAFVIRLPLPGAAIPPVGRPPLTTPAHP